MNAVDAEMGLNLRALREHPELGPILEARARALAPVVAARTTESGEELLVFQIGAERYAAAAQLLREVLPVGPITPLPGTPAPVLGLVNVRGRLLSAIDIRPLLDLAPQPLPAGALLLVVAAGGVEIGLVADAVLAVRPAAPTLAPSLGVLEGRPMAWVVGIEPDLTIRLDLGALVEALLRTVGGRAGEGDHG